MAVGGSAANKTMILSLIYISIYVVCVSGKYDLEIQPRYYIKEKSGCASCGNRDTCDSEANEIDCDNVFIFCTKPLGESVTINNMFLAECVTSGQILNKAISSDDIDFDELNTTYFLLFNGESWSGVQLFVVVIDEDGKGPHDVVDVFRADVTITLGSDYTNDTTYIGEFDFAEIGLSFRVNCSISYFGENCTDTDMTITDKRSISGYIVAGVVVAACVFGTILAVVIILTRKRRKYAPTEPEITEISELPSQAQVSNNRITDESICQENNQSSGYHAAEAHLTQSLPPAQRNTQKKEPPEEREEPQKEDLSISVPAKPLPVNTSFLAELKQKMGKKNVDIQPNITNRLSLILVDVDEEEIEKDLGSFTSSDDGESKD